MRKFMFFCAAMLMAISATAQNYSKVYYTPDQNTRHRALWVDNVQFTDQNTVVSLQYTGNTKGICLLPSTKLVVHLKGGRQFMLSMERAGGIPISPCRTTNDQGVVQFKAYFPSITMAEVNRIKYIDFIEVSAMMVKPGYFNVYDIRINKKNAR